MVAAKYGHSNLVEFYLNHGADSSIQAEVYISNNYALCIN